MFKKVCLVGILSIFSIVNFAQASDYPQEAIGIILDQAVGAANDLGQKLIAKKVKPNFIGHEKYDQDAQEFGLPEEVTSYVWNNDEFIIVMGKYPIDKGKEEVFFSYFEMTSPKYHIAKMRVGMTLSEFARVFRSTASVLAYQSDPGTFCLQSDGMAIIAEHDDKRITKIIVNNGEMVPVAEEANNYIMSVQKKTNVGTHTAFEIEMDETAKQIMITENIPFELLKHGELTPVRSAGMSTLIITGKKVFLKADPMMNGNNLFSVKKGQKVEAVCYFEYNDTGDTWYYVYGNKPQKGWVHSSLVKYP